MSGTVTYFSDLVITGMVCGSPGRIVQYSVLVTTVVLLTVCYENSQLDALDWFDLGSRGSSCHLERLLVLVYG